MAGRCDSIHIYQNCAFPMAKSKHPGVLAVFKNTLCMLLEGYALHRRRQAACFSTSESSGGHAVRWHGRLSLLARQHRYGEPVLKSDFKVIMCCTPVFVEGKL